MGTLNRIDDALHENYFRHIFRNELLVPVWSRQHGAYITILASWITAAGLSENFSLLHLVVLVFLLAGFNYWEILADSLRRKTKQDERKKAWGFIYLFSAALASFPLIELVPSSLVILPVTGAAAGAMLFVHLSRQTKSTLSEAMTFSAFAFGALMALNPASTPVWEHSLRLWAVMAVYFCLSIFIVKVRLNRISSSVAAAYTIAAMLFLIFLFGLHPLPVLVSVLMSLRLLPCLIAPEWYRTIKLKYIGISEALFQAAFITVVILLLR